MRRTLLWMTIAYLVVLATGLAWHWYAGTQGTPAARWLKDWYLYREPGNGKLNHITEGDILLPAIVLGLAMGGITSRRSIGEFAWYVFILPVGIAALQPVCVKFFPEHVWWSMSGMERVAAVGIDYARALMFVCAAGCLGRICAQHYQGRVPDE
jgi:hypothetical protein